MKAIAVAGGRYFTDKEAVFRALDDIRLRTGFDTVVCGGQRFWNSRLNRFFGVDHFTIEYAYERELDFIGFTAKWKKFGKRAGPERNPRVAWYPEVKWAAIFPGGTGTMDFSKHAELAFLKIFSVASVGLGKVEITEE